MMKGLLTVATALALTASPVVSLAQDSVKADEQIILKQLQTDKRAVYANNLNLTDREGRAFWPIYDEYEAAAKKVDDRFLALVDEFAAKFATMTEADAASMLKTKMTLENERMALKQKYTKKIASVLPAKKALRYAQIETRIENMIRSNVYSLIPLTP
jgi:hypothetical protein